MAPITIKKIENIIKIYRVWKNYERPEIKDIKIKLEDIIAVSNNGSTSGGGSSSLSDLFGGK